MSQDKGDFVDDTKSQFSQKLSIKDQLENKEQQQKQINYSSLLSKEMDPPRQLPKRSYSLEPDMIAGWKPKKINTSFTNNVFPLNCSCQIVDYILKQIYKKKTKQWQIAYLGPRKQNSYVLHQNRKYQNPYPLNKKQQTYISQRPQIPLNYQGQQKNLKFNSNFQCGNLDAAIFISNNQYDLFMRVDTNTKGHTNWYYFSVQNNNYVGSVRFNICNFRRQKSLYQRVFIYYYHINTGPQTILLFKKDKRSMETRWLKHPILAQTTPIQISLIIIRFLLHVINAIKSQFSLKTYITLTFTYHFDMPNDTIQFAYFIPYSYSRLLKFLEPLKNVKHLPSLKSLSGLIVPVLEIMDQNDEDYNKKVIVIAGRIHPGQSNSSYVCQGFMQHICSQELSAKQYRKYFITYIIPMINPDGVVAGNYRTSLFGKDLNRTYNTTRRFAFPETFHLLELIKDLKTKYKQKLNVFIDLHGHSVKKNIFMYGPQFNIHHPNYYIAKQLPKILSNICPYFRFYSCIFRISSQKSTTARATLNRYLNIPFTYTMESSNGFYYDSELKKQFQLNSKKLKKMGAALGEALIRFKEVQENRSMYNSSNMSHHIIHNNQSANNVFSGNKNKLALEKPSQQSNYQNSKQQQQQPSEKSQKILATKRQMKMVQLISLTEAHKALDLQKNEYLLQEFGQQNQDMNFQTNYSSPFIGMQAGGDQNYEILSDDNISEGNSDSQPSDQDLNENQLMQLLQTIQKDRSPQISPSKHSLPQSNSIIPTIFQTLNIFKCTKFSQRQIKNKNRYKKKNPMLPPINCLNRAKNKQTKNKSFLQTPIIRNLSPQKQKQKRSKHLSISQMIQDARNNIHNGGFSKKQEIGYGTLKKKTSKFQLQHNKIKFFSNNSTFNEKL